MKKPHCKDIKEDRINNDQPGKIGSTEGKIVSEAVIAQSSVVNQ